MPIFQASASLQANALIVFSDALFNTNATKLVALAARYAIPTIFPERWYVTAGGLFSYASSLADTDRIKGVYAGKSSRAPNRPLELVVNLKKAKALGLTVPRSILARADE
jgi:putative tryptophan/tyrosine transport system substrate-binding protein